MLFNNIYHFIKKYTINLNFKTNIKYEILWLVNNG